MNRDIHARGRAVPLHDVSAAGLLLPVRVSTAVMRSVIAWSAADEADTLRALGTAEPTGETRAGRQAALLRALARTVDTHRDAITRGRPARFTVVALHAGGSMQRTALCVQLIERDGERWLSVVTATIGTGRTGGRK